MIVRLDTRRIVDKSSFHATFADLMGFPDFYGANMDAWIDCMSSFRDGEANITQVHLGSDERLLIEVTDTEGFRARLPDVFNDLVKCTASVNRRYVDMGGTPAIGLVFL